MTLVQYVHDFLTSWGELAKRTAAISSLCGASYLDYLLYANEDAFWEVRFVLNLSNFW
jgi:hypothetical protein